MPLLRCERAKSTRGRPARCSAKLGRRNSDGGLGRRRIPQQPSARPATAPSGSPLLIARGTGATRLPSRPRNIEAIAHGPARPSATKKEAADERQE